MVDGDIERASESQLVRAVSETGKYAFMIGAGCSRPEPAEILTGDELIDEWKNECYNNESPDKDLEDWINKKTDEKREGQSDYGFWFEERHPTRGERKEYIKQLVSDSKPTLGHIILAAMMNEEYIPHTLTSNFDDLLFNAFYLFLEEKPHLIDHRVVAPEFRLTWEDPAIVKLHGDYLYDNIRNTDTETESLSDGMQGALQRTVSEYGLVVIGYSGMDDSIMKPLLEVDLSEYGLYWCVRDPDPGNLSPDVKELLAKSNTYLVEIDGFVNLMTHFARDIEDVGPPTPDDLRSRAENRAAMVEGVVKERQESDTDEEEEEYVDKLQLYQHAEEAHLNENYEVAIELWNDILDIDEDQAIVYYNRGIAKRELNRYEGSIDDFSKAIDLSPEKSEAYLRRGNSKADTGDTIGALNDYNKAIELDPEYALAYSNRGNMKLREGEIDQAREDYDTSVKIAPDQAYSYSGRGFLNLKQGNFDEAVEDLNKALDINPDSLPATLNRAELRLVKDDLQMARDDAKKARSLSSSESEKATALLLEILSVHQSGGDVSELEKKYRTLCEDDFQTDWNFDTLEAWIDDKQMSDEAEKYVLEMVNLLKEHQVSWM